MNCFVCSKKKEDFEVWTNKMVIGATYDSVFQEHDVVKNLQRDSVICHMCMKKIQDEVDSSR
ncbi:MAG: hypothetical protein ACE5DU_07240 [Nitrosopumilus sp.]